MANTTVTFEMDEELKKKMETACKNMGMTMGDAFTMFARKVVKDQCLPLELVEDPFQGKEKR